MGIGIVQISLSVWHSPRVSEFCDDWATHVRPNAQKKQTFV
jgi:hypothetical protein